LRKVVRALKVISRWDDTDSASTANVESLNLCTANTLKVDLCNCEFIISLFSLSDILSLTSPVSRHLQGEHVYFQDAKTQITNIICVLKTRRVDFAHFDSIFASACKCMNELDVPLVQPRVSQRQINRANPPAATPTELYRSTIYLPLLDAVITDMESRFSDETMSNFNDLAYFIPAVIARSTEVPVDLIDRLLRSYSGIIKSMYQFTLDGELALWGQKWSSLLSD